MEFLQNLNLQRPDTIRFGWGCRQHIPQLASELGRTALLVLGSRTFTNSRRYAELAAGLEQAGLKVVPLGLQTREPEVDDVDLMVTSVRDRLSDWERPFLLGVGGGSAIDLMKAVAALATNYEGDSVVDYLEGVGCGAEIKNPPLATLAVPTTAGTGSEATRNAVISSYDPAFKKSLRSPQMVPDAVVVDPELTVDVAKRTTAHSGMDAIVQLIESHVSCRSTDDTRLVTRAGIRGTLQALEQCVADGSNQESRTVMSRAALYSGIALANSGLGLAHGVAAALGVHCRIPHGLACALMLPAALRANRDVACERIAELAEPLGLDATGSAELLADRVIAAVAATSRRLGIPEQLGEIGVTASQIPELVASSQGNSMRGNPRDIAPAELQQILMRML